MAKKEKRVTERQFQSWLKIHPTYEPTIIDECLMLVNAGAEHLSMKHIFERLRSQGRLRYLDNTYTAWMARHVEKKEPKLRGKFEFRESPKKRR